MAIYGFALALLLALFAVGVVDVGIPDSIESPGLLAAAAFFGAIAALVLRRHFLRVKGTRLTIFFSLFVAVVVGLSVPADTPRFVIPQLIWLPSLIAAAICSIVWVPVVAAVSYGLLALRAGPDTAFDKPLSLLAFVLMLVLVMVVRWARDASLRQAATAQARMQQARYEDALTGLPNRFRFVELLDDALRRSSVAGTPVVVLRVDLEQFRMFTESLGREAGDAVLVMAAQRIGGALDADSVVARIGADDFVVLPVLADVDDVPSAATAAAESVADRLEEPFVLDGASLQMTPRVGVVVAVPDGFTDAEVILQRADTAVVAARAGGRRRVAVAPDAVAAPTERRFRISQELRRAVERGELSVAYQPIVDLTTGTITKAEALARWTHPELGPVRPDEFIPIAEATGVIHAIGDWVLEQAALQASLWRADGLRDFEVSVNRSPVQFREDVDGPHVCLVLLERLGVAPDCVAIELTEGVFLEAEASVTASLDALRAAGVKLSLDDFGTGYSSIGHLHRFDIDIVKIDRRFVQGLADVGKERILCQSIITMAHSLGMAVVAEGVETEAQRDVLVSLGCDYGQGYLFGKPQTAASLSELLASQVTH